MTAQAKSGAPLIGRARVRQTGVALLVVLILVAIVSVVISALFYRHELDKSHVLRGLRGDQSVLLALSAESYVLKLLRDDAEQNDTDSASDYWAQPIPVLPVEGGYISGCVKDLQAKINLNNFATYTPELWDLDQTELSSSYLDTYLNLLALLEMDSDESRAAVLVDWMDSDSDLISGYSAEDAEYLLESPARVAANMPLVELNELAALSGYSAQHLLALEPYVAALPVETAINVNTAPPLVMMSLTSLIDEYMLERLQGYMPFDSEDDFYEALSSEIGYLSVQELKENELPEYLIDVKSQFFQLIASVNLDQVQMQLTSLIYRANANSAQVLQRNFEVIPQIVDNEGRSILYTNGCETLEEEQ